ncbi:hypothetical protein DXG03_004459 [Asterophora parasitica]|uniref:Retrotransposon gag domain-containing protein n=1 Tax=Asterophora parasitica TaxID=117018 RepID=A0A9P7KFN1_9AGAR|nr:hypothetical protein DXG03_004459 [Asterophora parasitica]
MRNAFWLQCCALTTNYNCVIYFSFYLKDGSPASWYASIEKLRPNLLSNYHEFLEAFVHCFDDTDKHATALAKIQELKQEPGSVASYTSKFAEISANLNLDEESKMDYFYDGLKDPVKDSMVFVKKPKSGLFKDYVKSQPGL